MGMYVFAVGIGRAVLVGLNRSARHRPVQGAEEAREQSGTGEPRGEPDDGEADTVAHHQPEEFNARGAERRRMAKLAQPGADGVTHQAEDARAR